MYFIKSKIKYKPVEMIQATYILHMIFLYYLYSFVCYEFSNQDLQHACYIKQARFYHV